MPVSPPPTVDSPALHRLAQMRDFYTFLMAEIPALLDRWYQQSGSSDT